MKALTDVINQPRFFWFLKPSGWFAENKSDHIQQENDFTVLCQWLLSLACLLS